MIEAIGYMLIGVFFGLFIHIAIALLSSIESKDKKNG